MGFFVGCGIWETGCFGLQGWDGIGLDRTGLLLLCEHSRSKDERNCGIVV
jgi:hypothetical protein